MNIPNKHLTVTPLFATDTPQTAVTKVGVLPFVREKDGWCVLMMKPRPKKSFQAESLFQIPKGTRRIFLPEGERDMHLDDLEEYVSAQCEPLLATALREGAEEVGLRKDNIRQLWDAGVHHFHSASTGKRKRLYMFAAEIKDTKHFDPFEASTIEAAWISASKLKKQCRPDHVVIVEAIMARLMGIL